MSSTANAGGTECAVQLLEGIGSPGWARTSDFLINSPTRRRPVRAREGLSARFLEQPVRSHRLVDAGSPWCVGTNAEPRQASLALPAVLLDHPLSRCRGVDPVLVRVLEDFHPLSTFRTSGPLYRRGRLSVK